MKPILLILCLAVSVQAGTIQKRVIDTTDSMQLYYYYYDLVSPYYQGEDGYCTTRVFYLIDTTYIDIEVGSADCDTCLYKMKDVNIFIESIRVRAEIRMGSASDTLPCVPDTTIVCDTVGYWKKWGYWTNKGFVWADTIGFLPYAELQFRLIPCFTCDTTISGRR